MATGYGSWVATDDWRAVVDASVSYGSDKTVATVTVVCKVQSQYGSDNGTTTGTTQCGSSSGSTSGQSIYQGSTTTLRTQTFTVTRGTSDKTVTCKGIVRCDNSTYGGATSTASVDVSIVARPTYTIAYDANSGTGAPNNGTKQYDTAYTISSTKPTRTGYNFSQWHALGSSHDAWYNSGGTIPAAVNQNLTLYASWTLKTYTISYNGNGSTGGSTASQSKDHGASLTLRSNGFTRTGHTFSKWNTKADGSGTSYNAGGSYTTNASATLYAIWTANTYTVAFNANGGSGAPASQTKTYGKTLTLSSTKPTRTGYTFKGWATSSSSSTVAYSPGGSYTANAAVTLYAVWQINTYTISYNANGGSGAPSAQTKTHGATLKLSTTKPTRTGYQFDGWATSSSGSVAYAAGANYTANASATLYAHWTAIYTVSYAANGGSSTPASQTKVHGTALTLRAGISRSDATATYTVTYDANGGSVGTASATATKTTRYTFSKWKASDGQQYNASGSYTANAATTMTAQWTTTVTTDSVTLPTPTRTNYSFSGWYTASSGGTRVGGGGSSYTPSSNVKLYAQWTLSYVAPVISKLTAKRCLSNGTADDEGTYCNASLTWTPGSNSSSESVTFKATSGSTTETGTGTITSSGSTKTATCIFGGGNLSIATRYTITATITDGGTGASKTTILSPSFFTLHFLKGGKAIGIGQRVKAGLTGLFVNMASSFYKNIMVISSNITRNTAIASGTLQGDASITFRDSNGTNIGGIAPRFADNNREGMMYGTTRTVNGTVYGHWMYIYVDNAGKREVHFTDGTAWRNGLGASSGIWPASLGGTGFTDYGTYLVEDDSAGVSVANNAWKTINSLTLTKGRWLLRYVAEFPSNATGYRACGISTATDSTSTANLRQSGVTVPAANGASTRLNGSRIVNPTGNTAYYLVVRQNSGSALTTTSYIQAVKIG